MAARVGITKSCSNLGAISKYVTEFCIASERQIKIPERFVFIAYLCIDSDVSFNKYLSRNPSFTMFSQEP